MCGILAIYNYNINGNHSNVDPHIQEQLKNLQHRGQDSYGYYLYHSETQEEAHIRELGLIKKHNIRGNYHFGLGHTRYSTSYSKNKNLLEHIQPNVVHNNIYGKIVFCFNGNINNIEKIAKEFNISYQDIVGFNDTIMLHHIIQNSQHSNIENLWLQIIHAIKGVFNLLIYHVSHNTLYLIKDKTDNRPLCIGKNENGYCVSSESVALGDYTYLFEIEGGNILKINDKGLNNIYSDSNFKKYQHKCLFEYIYLQNKNSKCQYDVTIEDIREDLGQELARQEMIKIDISNKIDIVVIGAPNTAIPIGIKYAECLDIEYNQFIKKRRGTVRSFIQNNNESRLAECYRKFELNPEFSIQNKIVIFVDDSLVRGNTIKTIIDLLSSLQPKELHIRIASPEVKHPCYFGIDIPTSEELIMNSYSTQSFSQKLKITSFRFLQPDNMSYVLKKKLKLEGGNICMSCFTGDYSPHLDF